MPLPRPEDHPSYRRHRRQVWAQIVLPILLAALGVVALIVLVSLSSLRGQGDVGRWAAISTIWLTPPMLIGGLILLAALIAVNYLLGRLTHLIPPYSNLVQRFFYRIEGGAKRAAEVAARPALLLGELRTLVTALIKRLEKG